MVQPLIAGVIRELEVSRNKAPRRVKQDLEVESSAVKSKHRAT